MFSNTKIIIILKKKHNFIVNSIAILVFDSFQQNDEHSVPVAVVKNHDPSTETCYFLNLKNSRSKKSVFFFYYRSESELFFITDYERVVIEIKKNKKQENNRRNWLEK